ncbi:hypothetical protein SESBI_12202 [Sesbania bispinosa]|nr:hypothetical protein SESBI_12202 [Sesbania bispinosa]
MAFHPPGFFLLADSEPFLLSFSLFGSFSAVEEKPEVLQHRSDEGEEETEG